MRDSVLEPAPQRRIGRQFHTSINNAGSSTIDPVETRKATPTIIRSTTTIDIPAMQGVERAAGQIFAGYGMPEIAAHPPLDAGILAAYIHDGRAWVGESEGSVVGYALADIVDNQGHLEQVSVDPCFGRQGLGRRLIRTVVDWASAQGFTALTLITCRDVPWNGPYYAELGFQVLEDAILRPQLRTLRVHERDLGLDPNARQVMRLEWIGGDPIPAE